MSCDTRPEDYTAFLQELESAGQSYFLEGGQSVNFWAEYVQATGLVGESLDSFLPFTSLDCDIWVSYPTFQYLKGAYREELITGSSPSDGQLGILNLPGNRERRVDLLSNVFGIPENQIARALERSLSFNGIRVLDPVFLFRSKCHCLVNLDQIGRQDRKHVEMLCLILPAYFRLLHEAAERSEISERQLLKEVKMFRALDKDKFIRLALTEVGQGLDFLLPVNDFAESSLKTLAAFARTTWRQ